MGKKFVSIFLFFHILIISCVNGSAQSKENLLDKLRNANSFEYNVIGYSPEESELYKTAQELVNLCDDKELIDLLSDKSPVVKCYAAHFVADRDIEADWYKILTDEITDYKKILFMAYDVGSFSYAGDFIFDTLFSKKLNQDEQKKIKLELIKKQSDLSFARSILLADEKSDELYEASRNWALKGNEEAIFSLAKYGKKEDSPLIETLKNKNKALYFRACRYSISDSYKDFLREYMISIMPEKHYFNEWEFFYKLVADYHDDFSKEIFDMAFSDKVNKDIQKYHLRYVFKAVKNFSDGFYDEYLETLWLQYNLIDKNVIDLFLKKDKSLALDKLKKALDNSNEYFMNTEVLDYMIKSLHKNNVDLTDFFIKGITKDSVTTLKVYMDNIDCIQGDDKRIVDAMKSRLNTETNSYVTLPLYKHLVSLNDKSINEYLIKQYKKKKKSYAKWSLPELKKILEPIMP